MTLDVGAAFRTSRDLLLNPMPLVACRLDGRLVVRHGLLAAIHVDVGKVGVDQLALVEHRLDPSPVRVGVLIRAGNRVDVDGLPCLGEALVLSST